MQDRDIKRLRYDCEYYYGVWLCVKWGAIAMFFIWIGTKING